MSSLSGKGMGRGEGPVCASLRGRQRQMRRPGGEARIAILALSQAGASLGRRLQSQLEGSILLLPPDLCSSPWRGVQSFEGDLRSTLEKAFSACEALVCIMACGIVVRLLTPLIRHKREDPAVVVMDEEGRFAISLLSGHLGGANRLAQEIASLTGAEAVITTASDAHGVPSLDLIAEAHRLISENPSAFQGLQRALNEGGEIWVWDPEGILRRDLEELTHLRFLRRWEEFTESSPHPPAGYLLVMRDRMEELALDRPTLVLRPRDLVVGMGLHRDTPMEELEEGLRFLLDEYSWSPLSLCKLATIESRRGHQGLSALGERWSLPIAYFSREQLNSLRGSVDHSPQAWKYLSVEGVCEPAALLGAKAKALLVRKRKWGRVTLAVARADSM